jgi:type II secretory ATPase GspE/PulE/Tfp pilus assembly ATPase PilB-like protein
VCPANALALRSYTMIDTALYKKILIGQKYITQQDAELADEFVRMQRGSFIEGLMEHDAMNRSTLGLALAEFYKTSFTDLATRVPTLEDLLRIPEQTAKKLRVVCVEVHEAEVLVATDDPPYKGLREILSPFFSGKNITISYALPDDVTQTLGLYQKELNTRFSAIIQRGARVAPELFEEVVRDAIQQRASDIHFEPQEEHALVRFRIDGALRHVGYIPKEYYEQMLNRVKIQANLRTDEHATPQDGAIRFNSEHFFVDLRVSIVPAIAGEKVVIRVLAQYVRGLTFADLGFSESQARVIEEVARKPFGMIVVSGPTGSGKTTTLYSLIKKLNTPEVNITTIEDPVEYRIIGANQLQVNLKTGLTFAKGLRAIVRQDPNIILVGEIRDIETAETAVNAALTGHLLFSTFHANDAASTIPRLLDMGIEPFLLSSTLELIVSQRLVRRICESCRTSYTEKVSLLPSASRGFFTGKHVTLFRGKGCARCNGSGYHGRASIVEMITITKSLRECIAKRPSASEVATLARKEGLRSMFEDGIDKALEGVTTLDEVVRLTTPPPTKRTAE